MEKSKKKSSRGRQKIEIKRIENQAARQVAFTKRRQGVMKKASELSVLCGAEVAILVLSPAGQPFSYGQPSVDAVVSHFLSRSPAPAASVGSSTTGGGRMAAEWLNIRCMEMEQKLQAEREKKAGAEERLRAAMEAVGVMERVLGERDIEGLGVAEMEAAERVMEEVRLRVVERQKEVMLAAVPRPGGAVAARPISMVAPPGAVAGGGMAASYFRGAGAVAAASEGIIMEYHGLSNAGGLFAL